MSRACGCGRSNSSRRQLPVGAPPSSSLHLICRVTPAFAFFGQLRQFTGNASGDRDFRYLDWIAAKRECGDPTLQEQVGSGFSRRLPNCHPSSSARVKREKTILPTFHLVEGLKHQFQGYQIQPQARAYFYNMQATRTLQQRAFTQLARSEYE